MDLRVSHMSHMSIYTVFVFSRIKKGNKKRREPSFFRRIKNDERVKGRKGSGQKARISPTGQTLPVNNSNVLVLKICPECLRSNKKKG